MIIILAVPAHQTAIAAPTTVAVASNWNLNVSGSET